MRTFKNILFSAFILISGTYHIGCKPEKPVDREAIREEMESRELKRISEGDLMAKGEEIGKEALEAVEKKFQSALMDAVAEKGVDGAITYCNLNAMEIVKQLEDSLGISIRRVTDKPRNPTDTLNRVETEIWEAYAYSPENATAQLQELSKTELIYTKPIRISSGLCLNCHGGVGQEITAENDSLIKKLYPGDKATGYEQGDLRGMWSLLIPKKVVVDEL